MTPTLLDQLDTLGQETRMNIVRALCAEGELSFRTIATRVQLVQGLYYHLKRLKEAGLVETRKVDNKRVVYFASVATLEDMRAGLAHFIGQLEEVHV